LEKENIKSQKVKHFFGKHCDANFVVLQTPMCIGSPPASLLFQMKK